jgi:Holliday junction resolvase RusA-like endonuclease
VRVAANPGAELCFTVPLTPPSTNHYKNKNRHTGHWYIRPEWTAFKSAVGLFARGRRITAKRYAVDLGIFLGKRKRGDSDNFAKVCLDGLQDAGVIHSDAAVKSLSVRVERDWKNPRTDFTVKALCPTVPPIQMQNVGQ